jgi:hypothetical protein
VQTRLLTMQFVGTTGIPVANKRVWITPSARILDLVGSHILEPVPVIFNLDETGYAEVELLCTNSTEITPVGFTYQLNPTWKNSNPIDFALPYGPNPVDLSTLTPTSLSRGVAITVGPQGPMGPVGVTVSQTAPGSPSLNQLWLQTA